MGVVKKIWRIAAGRSDLLDTGLEFISAEMGLRCPRCFSGCFASAIARSLWPYKREPGADMFSTCKSGLVEE